MRNAYFYDGNHDKDGLKMGSVKSAVFSFLVTLIFCAVISSLVKKERASRILRPIFAVYILVAASSLTLFAVKNAKLPELSKYKETLSGGTLQNTYSDVISSLIFEQLKKAGTRLLPLPVLLILIKMATYTVMRYMLRRIFLKNKTKKRWRSL